MFFLKGQNFSQALNFKMEQNRQLKYLIHAKKPRCLSSGPPNFNRARWTVRKIYSLLLTAKATPTAARTSLVSKETLNFGWSPTNRKSPFPLPALPENPYVWAEKTAIGGVSTQPRCNCRCSRAGDGGGPVSSVRNGSARTSEPQ